MDHHRADDRCQFGATATALPDGSVLAAGGCSTCSNQSALPSAEFFSNGVWFPVHSMTQPRVFQTATALPGGSVLVAGGGPTYYAAAASTAEVFTPVLMSVNPASGRRARRSASPAAASTPVRR